MKQRTSTCSHHGPFEKECAGCGAERSEVVSAPQAPYEYEGEYAEFPKSVDGGARPDHKELDLLNFIMDSLPGLAGRIRMDEVTKLAEHFGATDGGARELEQAAQRVVTLYEADAEDVEIDAAMDELRLAVDRRKR